MKIALAIFTSLLGSAAVADTYLCQVEGTDQTLLLRKLKNLPTNQSEDVDTKATYSLQLQTTELPFPSVDVSGIATTADVFFVFKSDDRRYQVFMYLDDSEGTLMVDKKKYSFSDCQFFE